MESDGQQPGHLGTDPALLFGSHVAQGEPVTHSEPPSASGFSGVVNGALPSVCGGASREIQTVASAGRRTGGLLELLERRDVCTRWIDPKC